MYTTKQYYCAGLANKTIPQSHWRLTGDRVFLTLHLLASLYCFRDTAVIAQRVGKHQPWKRYWDPVLLYDLEGIDFPFLLPAVRAACEV